MSKKNNKSTKKRAHSFALRRAHAWLPHMPSRSHGEPAPRAQRPHTLVARFAGEADDAAKRKVTQEKKAAKATKNPGVKKNLPKKKKGLRIRKNVVIRASTCLPPP